VEKAEKEIERVEIKDEVSDVVCDKCGRMMVIKYGPHGKFLACPGFPECRNTKPILTKIGVKCPKCGGDLIERHSKTGRLFYGCANYPSCRFTSWDKPTNMVCPDCGSMMVEHMDRRGHKILHCSNEKCPNSTLKRSAAVPIKKEVNE